MVSSSQSDILLICTQAIAACPTAASVSLRLLQPALYLHCMLVLLPEVVLQLQWKQHYSARCNHIAWDPLFEVRSKLSQWRRTLPSNLALCVNPDFDYVRAKDSATGKVYVVAETRLASVPGAVPKAKKGAKDKKGAEPAKGWEVSLLPTPSLMGTLSPQNCQGNAVKPATVPAGLVPRASSTSKKDFTEVVNSAHSTGEMSGIGKCCVNRVAVQVLSKVKGRSLVGTMYQPLFPYFAHLKTKAAAPLPNGTAANGVHPAPSGAFRVVSDAYVKDDSGTGVVHQAPAFGEDDFRICIENSEPDFPFSITCVQDFPLTFGIPPAPCSWLSPLPSGRALRC